MSQMDYREQTLHPALRPVSRCPDRIDPYERLIASASTRLDHLAMAKRLTSLALWFYAGWVAGAFIALVLGLSESLGPIVGAAAAAIFAGDPRRIIWTRSAVGGAEQPS
jgi:hypothetical protein